MMGTQAKRQQDWEKTRKGKSTTSGLNKYNPTQPSQFAKTLTPEEYQRKLYQKECLEQEKSSI